MREIKFRAWDNLRRVYHDCDTNQLNCEVVGNVHENPELPEE
jgi:hypothetical protein